MLIVRPKRPFEGKRRITLYDFMNPEDDPYRYQRGCRPTRQLPWMRSVAFEEGYTRRQPHCNAPKDLPSIPIQTQSNRTPLLLLYLPTSIIYYIRSSSLSRPSIFLYLQVREAIFCGEQREFKLHHLPRKYDIYSEEPSSKVAVRS